MARRRAVRDPRHPYTRALLASPPQAVGGGEGMRRRLCAIPGAVIEL